MKNVVITPSGGSNGRRGFSGGGGGTTAHDFGGSLHNGDTIANIKSKVIDGSLFTTDTAEIQPLPSKNSPIGDDLLLIEDSEEAFSKKSASVRSVSSANPFFIPPVISVFDNSINLPMYPSPSSGDRYIAGETANGWTKNNIYEAIAGPYKILAWSPVSSGLTTDPDNTIHRIGIFNTAYILGTGNGFFQSGNQAASWNFIAAPGETVLGVDSIDGYTALAVTTSHVYKTTDCGATWNVVTTGLPGEIVFTSIVYDGNSDYFYIGTTTGMYRCSSTGYSWTAYNRGLGSTKIITSLCKDGYNVFACGNFGTDVVAMKLNAGTWLPLGNLTGGVGCMIKSMNGAMYLGNSTDGIVYRRNGGSWIPVSPSGYGTPVDTVYHTRGFYVLGTTTDTLQSATADNDWETIETGLDSNSLTAFGVDSTLFPEPVIYGGSKETPQGVYKSIIGNVVTWKETVVDSGMTVLNKTLGTLESFVLGVWAPSPFKMTDGVLLTTPQAGAIEFSENVLYITLSNGVRKQIAFV